MSLVPLLRGTAKAWLERTLFDLSGRGGKDGAPMPLYPGTARTPTHRWVHDGKQEYLFDLRNDPGEATNVAAANPDAVAKLRARADAADGDLGKTGIGPGVRTLGTVESAQPLLGRDGQPRAGFEPKP